MSQNDQYGDSTELSPSQAFRPRNPGVIRTPPAGTSQPLPPQPRESTPRAMENENDTMEVDDPIAGPSAVPGTPAKSQSQPTREIQTPARQRGGEAGPSLVQTPRSTRKNPPALPAAQEVPGMDIEPADVSIEEEGEYGRRWRKTLETLDLATKAAAQKWTAKDLKQCFPTLAADDSGELDGIWLQAATTMKERLMELGMDVMKHYKVPTSLQQIDEVVKEGQVYAAAHKKDKGGRPDAWRPDTTPEILTAATQLAMYDEAHARIRDEYLVLHEDSKTRYLSILEKHAKLIEMENGVADGVADLEKTIQLLEGFPNEEMMVWMEESSGMMGGARDQ